MEQNSVKVVVVHGVASHRSVMWPIAYRLWYDGFRAETWTYVNRIESNRRTSSKLGYWRLSTIF
ncbi:MAG: hypothetical protein ACK5OC_04700 [Pirellula sp.]